MADQRLHSNMTRPSTIADRQNDISTPSSASLEEQESRHSPASPSSSMSHQERDHNEQSSSISVEAQSSGEHSLSISVPSQEQYVNPDSSSSSSVYAVPGSIEEKPKAKACMVIPHGRPMTPEELVPCICAFHTCFQCAFKTIRGGEAKCTMCKKEYPTEILRQIYESGIRELERANQAEIQRLRRTFEDRARRQLSSLRNTMVSTVIATTVVLVIFLVHKKGR